MQKSIPRKIHRLQRGQVALGAVLLFLFISSTIVFGMARAVYHQLKTALDFGTSRSSYYLSESLAEDTAYRFIAGFSTAASPTLAIDGETASAVVTNEGTVKQIVSTANWNGLYRKVVIQITYGLGTGFSYGVQAGDGGFVGSNNTIIYGNLFSNGPITGSALIKGDVISAGPLGFISGIHATSSAYAHTIANATIDKDAYYQEISGSTVGGASHPGSPDQAPSTMPIPDSYIATLENAAEASGVTACSGTYQLNAGTVSSRKYTCSVNINGDITLTGPLWVEGNITTSNNVDVSVSGTLPGKTVAIIADNPSDRINSSKITQSNNLTFAGSGAQSYVMLISMNNAEEVNASNNINAISVNNNISGALLIYAPHGQIDIGNNTSLKEVTGYKILLSNNAQVQYETGIANLLFTSGPTGGFNVVDWRETQ